MTRPLDAFSFHKLEFDKNAALVDPQEATGVAQLAAQVDELIVISHGWNNDENDALSMYQQIAASLTAVREQGHEPALQDRSIGIVGVFWPSKKFADSDLIPGGAAAVTHTDPTLAADLTALGDAFDDPQAQQKLDKAAALVPRLDMETAARREYADLLRSLIEGVEHVPLETPDRLFTMDGDELLDELDPAALATSIPPATRPPAGQGGALSVPVSGALKPPTGGAAGLGDWIGSLTSKGRALLNFVTYYQMKARAGHVGADGLAPVLAQQLSGVTAADGSPKSVRLHLVGHSFGARLVTAAATALPAPVRIASVSLLQGAFSHYSFAKQWDGSADGAYRGLLVPEQLDGPMIITHTRNDTAVGTAYAIASRIADQVASAIGDANDVYGGLGSNGAQRTPEARDDQALGDVTADYTFVTGAVHNLLADAYISGHSDIKGPQVAHAVLRAVAATI